MQNIYGDELRIHYIDDDSANTIGTYYILESKIKNDIVEYGKVIDELGEYRLYYLEDRA